MPLYELSTPAQHPVVQLVDINGNALDIPSAAQVKARSFNIHALAPAYSHITFDTYTQLSSRYNAGSVKASGGQNSEIVYLLDFALLGGTWKLQLLHTATTDRGIYTIAASADASTWTDIGTIDGYAATLTQTVSPLAGVAMPDGTLYLRLKMLTKNASSSNYNTEISGLYGVRTGA